MKCKKAFQKRLLGKETEKETDMVAKDSERKMFLEKFFIISTSSNYFSNYFLLLEKLSLRPSFKSSAVKKHCCL